MPLPHFPGGIINPQTIYTNKFEATISSKELTSLENSNLSVSISKVRLNTISIKLSMYDLIDTLIKINNFDLVVKSTSRRNDKYYINHILTYENCYFTNTDFDLLCFDNSKEEIMTIDMIFNYDGDFNYYNKDNIKQYERLVKLKRILKNKI